MERKDILQERNMNTKQGKNTRFSLTKRQWDFFISSKYPNNGSSYVLQCPPTDVRLYIT